MEMTVACRPARLLQRIMLSNPVPAVLVAVQLKGKRNHCMLACREPHCA